MSQLERFFLVGLVVLALLAVVVVFVVPRLEPQSPPSEQPLAPGETETLPSRVIEVLEEGKNTTVRAGEFYIVRSGIEHRVVPRGHVKLMLFEPAGISHTGKVKAEITKDRFDRLSP